MFAVEPPLISAIMLTADRPALAAKAIASFLSQTWPNKELIIWDSGQKPLPLELIPGVGFYHGQRKTIGEMRNAAISRSCGKVIAHWDDDDLSHPKRMAEQYDLLAAADCDMVGYSSMVFRREDRDPIEHWIYAADEDGDGAGALGTSLMYRRSVWEKRRFRSVNVGEDGDFQLRRHVVTQLGHRPVRMIARHHGGNVSGDDRRFIAGNQFFETPWTKVSDPLIIGAAEELLKTGKVW